MEEYKRIIIDGKTTTYLIYNDGRVLNQKSGKFLKGSVNKGYRYYCLTTKDWKRNFFAHRLVALMFIPNPENLPIVHHKDGDTLNNNYNNLEWVTASENAIMVTRKVPRSNKRPKYCYYNGEIAVDEVWKLYKDTNFRISNYGRLWNICTNRILKQHITSCGYAYYSPKINGKTTKLLVHRAVYEAFNNMSLSREQQIDHIDGNKLNNKLNNLRLCSAQENCQYRSDNQKKRNGYYIEQLNDKNEVVARYESIADAAKWIGVTHGSISSCVNGKCPTIKGYKWRKVLE